MINLYKKIKLELPPLIQEEKRIAIAVSGGSDSLSMAILLSEYAKECGIEIIAITVDHKLRAESALEAKQVNKWLKKYGIEHHILCWEADKKSSNIQAEARKARYNLMAEFCVEKNIKLLAVAHTLEDQAETVLMRLMRGSGVDGLAGIADSSEVFGIKVIRPVIKFTKKDLQQYLLIKKQEWINDPSNENTKFKRVEVRNFIKLTDDPELLIERVSQTASHMLRAKNYIETVMRERLVGVINFNQAGFYTIDTNLYNKLHPEEQLRSLAAILQHVGGQHYRPRFENLINLHEKILAGKIVSGCTLWGCEISYSKKKNSSHIIYIYREPSLVSPAIKVLRNSTIVWDERFLCQIGDVNEQNLFVGALGVEGYNSISSELKDKLSAKKMPKKVIYTLPALRALEKLLVVPHIGYYGSEELNKNFYSKIKTPPGLFVI